MECASYNQAAERVAHSSWLCHVVRPDEYEGSADAAPFFVDVQSVSSVSTSGVFSCGVCTGSTMDAMSDAIEGADVMLYGVSLAYKESANVSGSSCLVVWCDACSWWLGFFVCLGGL